MTLEEHTKEGTELTIQGVIFGVVIGGAAVLACFDTAPWIAGLFGFSSGLFFGLALMAWAKVRAWKRILSPTDGASPDPDKGQAPQTRIP